jgi:hypothetical protein
LHKLWLGFESEHIKNLLAMTLMPNVSATLWATLSKEKKLKNYQIRNIEIAIASWIVKLNSASLIATLFML